MKLWIASLSILWFSTIVLTSCGGTPGLSTDNKLPQSSPVEAPSSTLALTLPIPPPLTDKPLPACDSIPELAENVLLQGRKTWLLVKAAELAGGLPGLPADWTKNSVTIGQGSLTELQGALLGYIEEDVSYGEGMMDKGNMSGYTRVTVINKTIWEVNPGSLGWEKTEGISEGDESPLIGVSLELIDEAPVEAYRWAMRIFTRHEASSTEDSPTLVPNSAAKKGTPVTFVFSIFGEFLDPLSGVWIPICEDSTNAGSTNLPVQPEAKVAIISEGGTDCFLLAVLDSSVYSRFPERAIIPVLGQTSDGAWWQVGFGTGEEYCWLPGESVYYYGQYGTATTIELTPTPTMPQVTPTKRKPRSDTQKSEGCYYNQISHHWICAQNDPPNATKCDY